LTELDNGTAGLEEDPGAISKPRSPSERINSPELVLLLLESDEVVEDREE
jgi:hypothetical protein